MTTKTITCSMCGFAFDPDAYPTCSSCPLQKNCQLACCPNCGYEMVNLRRSALARFATRLLPNKRIQNPTNAFNLAEVSPGSEARVIDFSGEIPAGRKAHLQAYGLIPGRSVRVVQHSPVTVVQVEHTELALEASLARMVQVESLDS